MSRKPSKEQRIETLAHGRQKEELRHGLMSGLKLSLPIAERAVRWVIPAAAASGLLELASRPAPAERKTVLPTAHGPAACFAG